MAPIELETQDKLEYSWFLAGPSGAVFRVKAANDAHIGLSPLESETEPMLEIFIGGWGNKKSVIRRNRSKPDVVEVETPNILSAGEFKGFWVRWDNGNITVGHEGEAASFLSYQNPNPFPINFIGLCTGWGASGSWVLDTPQGSASRWLPQGAQGGASRWLPQGAQGGNAVWVGASGSNIPSGAFVGGHDNGEGLVVGRAHHEGALIPGKVVPSHGVCYVAWGGGEHGKTEYEVLVGNASWVHGAGTNMPPNAVPAGETEGGEPLFVGKAKHEGTETIGKIQPSHGVCYISYAGQELAFKEFEVLVA